MKTKIFAFMFLLLPFIGVTQNKTISLKNVVTRLSI